MKKAKPRTVKAPARQKPSTPPARPTRSQWTVKGQAITPELRNAVSLAAKKCRLPQSDYIAAALWDRTQADLKGGPKPAPQQAQPPARMDELERRLDRLATAVEKLAAKPADPVSWVVDGVSSWTGWLLGAKPTT